MTRKKLPFAIASLIAGMFGSGAVYALGLGEIKLFSHLNEPLQAEVELVEVGDLNADDIVPKLASKEAFDKAEIERDFFLTQINYKVIILPDGRGVLKLSTEKPVKEPYLDFILDTTWANGHVLKQYTLLLDPPTYSAEGASPTVSNKEEAAPEEVKTSADIAQTETSEPTATSSQSQPQVPMGTERYTTKRNDTLWRIASKHQTGDASVFQTMDAIYKLNSTAFIKNNRNLLKTDQMLRMPSAEEITYLAQGGSVEKLLNAQQEPQLSTEQAASSETGASSEDKLKIVGSTSTGAATSAGTSESIDKIDRDNQDLNVKLSELTSQVQKMQQLIKLQDEQLTSLQQQLGGNPSIAEKKEAVEKLKAELSRIEAEINKTPVAVTSAPAVTSVPATVVPTQPAPTTATVAVATVQPTAAPVVTQAPAVKPTEKPVAKKPVVVTPEKPVEEKSNSMWVILIGVLLAAAALAVMFGKNKRKTQTQVATEKETDWSVDALRDEPSLAETMSGISADDATAPVQPETKQPAIAIPESQSQAKLDSLADANQMVAEGDLVGGINVLKEAVAQQTTRLDLRTRLLELSLEVGDIATFEAQESYISRWGGAAAKKLAVALREKINTMPPTSAPTPPSTPKESAATAVGSAPTAKPATAAPAPTEALASLDNLFDESPTPAKTEEAIDFNLSDFEAPPKAAAPAPTKTPLEEMDLSAFDAAPAEDTSETFEHLFDDIPSEPKSEEVDFAAELGLLDEDFDSAPALSEAEASLTVEKPSVTAEAQATDGAIEYSPPQEQSVQVATTTPASVGEGEEDDEFAFLAGTDEAATKLDLAKAYIDMEDFEGAKDILQEVLQEGNEAQQQEAKDLLARL